MLTPQKGLEFPGRAGRGGSLRPKHLKKCIKLNWNFQRDGWGLWKKITSMGRYLHNVCVVLKKSILVP